MLSKKSLASKVNVSEKVAVMIPTKNKNDCLHFLKSIQMIFINSWIAYAEEKETALPLHFHQLRLKP